VVSGPAGSPVSAATPSSGPAGAKGGHTVTWYESTGATWTVVVVVAGTAGLPFFGAFSTVDVGGGSVLTGVGAVVDAVVELVVEPVVGGVPVVRCVFGSGAADSACGRSFGEGVWPHADAAMHTANTSEPSLRRGTVTATYRQIAGRG
jgi:hypothetical protein